MSFAMKSVQNGTRMGDMDVCKMTPNQYIFIYGGSGGPPPEKFWLQGTQFVHSSAYSGSLYSNTPTLPP